MVGFLTPRPPENVTYVSNLHLVGHAPEKRGVAPDPDALQLKVEATRTTPETRNEIREA